MKRSILHILAQLFGIVLVASLPTACANNGDMGSNSPACEAFLASAVQYGIYGGGTPVRIFQRTEDQLVRDSEGTTLRIQDTEQISVLNCTFSARPQVGAAVTVRYEGVGIPLTAGTAEFQALKSEGTRIWLWNEKLEIGIVADNR